MRRYEERYTPHGIRKGAAQSYILNGTDRKLVMRIGGWESDDGLAIYENDVLLYPRVEKRGPPLASLDIVPQHK